jgi:hypothetical protein
MCQLTHKCGGHINMLFVPSSIRVAYILLLGWGMGLPDFLLSRSVSSGSLLFSGSTSCLSGENHQEHDAKTRTHSEPCEADSCFPI